MLTIRKRSQAKAPHKGLEKGRFVLVMGVVLSVCPATSSLPSQSLPMLCSDSSQGLWLPTSWGPGFPSCEISHIPQSVFHRRVWYLISWEKLGTILKLENNKKKHNFLVGEMVAWNWHFPQAASFFAGKHWKRAALGRRELTERCYW